MDELLQSLLTPQQLESAQTRAQQAGLLNLAFGMLQASQGQPGQGRPSLGQIIGQAGPVGVQAYQSSFDKTLKEALLGMQIQEMKRKQAEEQQRRALTSQMFDVTRAAPPTTGAFDAAQGLDVMQGGAGVVPPQPITGVRIRTEMLPALAALPGGAEQAAALLKLQESLKPKQFTLKPGEQVIEEGGRVVAGVPDKPDFRVIDNELVQITPKSDGTYTVNTLTFGGAVADKPLPEKLGAQIRGIELSAKALADLKQEVASKGVAYLKRDKTFSELKTAYQKALFNLKDLYELGALQAGDVEQINYLLQDPTSLSGWYLGKEGVLTSIESVEGLIRDRAEALKRTTPEKFRSRVNVPTFPTIEDVLKKHNLERAK